MRHLRGWQPQPHAKKKATKTCDGSQAVAKKGSTCAEGSRSRLQKKSCQNM